MATILLAATCRWVSGARLAIGFRDAGARVEAVCPGGSPALKTRAVTRGHRYHALAPLRSFTRAIEATQPDLVVPIDDLATRHLHDLYYRELRAGRASAPIVKLIGRSLGEPVNYRVIEARNELMAVARNEGITTPETAVVRSSGHLRDWLGQKGFPCVLKSDGTSSGAGVKVARTLNEAERAFRMMNAPELAVRVAKRIVIDRDLTLVSPFLLRKRPVINVQTYISGRDATSAVACWKGKVVAAISFEVLHTWKPMGPASVVRQIDNRQMSEAAEKIARRLDLTGFYGLDFKLENGTGDAYLIEMNPRAPQTSHLRPATGMDLPSYLVAAVSGQLLRETANVTNSRVIALFPQEWHRDPTSEFLECAYHDVPWSEPELVRMCMKNRFREGGWQSSEKWRELWPNVRHRGIEQLMSMPLKFGRFTDKKVRTASTALVSESSADEFDPHQPEVLQK